MDTYDFLSSTLALPGNAIGYSVSEKLSSLFPERAVVEGQLAYCDVEKFAANGLCRLESRPGVHNQLSSVWDEEFGIWKTARNAWYQVEWKGHVLDCLILTWTAGFQDQRFLSELHAVPWKRGVLFVGPPGNGKTHAVKALINAIGKPCLYVKSFQAEHMTEHDCIRQAFKRARKSAPCIFVLEDLDSLINANNRSFFLNELDDFAANTGVVALATTNHPERLDASILDRPSRFDRKYHFDLPGPAERLAYVRLWAASLREALHPSEAGLDAVVGQTDGFSFAYLKELFLSAMMRWIAAPGAAAMDAILLEQCESLRHQMASAPPEPPAAEKTDITGMPPWMRHLPRRPRYR